MTTFDARTRLWLPEAPAVHTIRNREVEIVTPVAVQGRWNWALLNRGGEAVRSSGGWQKNLIVNAGLDSLAISTAMSYCGVGANNTAPAVTQTVLLAQVGARTSSNGGFTQTFNNNVGNLYSQTIKTFLFDFSEVNGNLTEVGLFGNSAGTPMFMRQLFLDETSTPTVVVKTVDFQLKVQYEYRTYWYNGDETLSMTVNGVARNVRQRRSDNAYWTLSAERVLGAASAVASLRGGPGAAFNAAGNAPTGGTATNYNQNSSVFGTYVNGSFFRDYTLRWDSAYANGLEYTILEMSPNGPSGWDPIKVDLTNLGASGAGVTKDNTQRFVVNLRRVWSRYP
jgi:hypothetical protein